MSNILLVRDRSPESGLRLWSRTTNVSTSPFVESGGGIYCIEMDNHYDETRTS